MINYRVILQSQQVLLFLEQEGLEKTEKVVQSIHLSTRNLECDVFYPVVRGKIWAVNLREWNRYKKKKAKERRGRKINGML